MKAVVIFVELHQPQLPFAIKKKEVHTCFIILFYCHQPSISVVQIEGRIIILHALGQSLVTSVASSAMPTAHVVLGPSWE